MDRKELLLFILGYLNGINLLESIPKDSLLKIKEIVEQYDSNQKIFREEKKLEEERWIEMQDGLTEQSGNRSSYNNDDSYNNTLDLDQQSEDFYS